MLAHGVGVLVQRLGELQDRAAPAELDERVEGSSARRRELFAGEAAGGEGAQRFTHGTNRTISRRPPPVADSWLARDDAHSLCLWCTAMNHIDGGPGWIIDGKTLLPRIVDPEEFRRSLADDPLREGIEALWSGRPDEAAELIEAHEPTFRTRALRADCLRDQGELDLAIAEYRELIDECAGTAWEADRKSTRLNSSHVAISYAVFCLKKKKN